MISVKILSYVLVTIGAFLIIGYYYLVVRIMPRNEGKVKILGWVSMIIISLAVLAFFTCWMLWEPLAKDFFPAFVIISLVVGFLFMKSAVSPYRLAEFWSELDKQRKEQKK